MCVALQCQQVSASYEVTGPRDAPAVIVLGGISATRHACAHEDNRAAGWWDSMAGPRRAIDTNALRVIGVDYLDGGVRADGRPERIVTTDDQAIALAAVLDTLGVARVHAIVGASYGGMVALAFAARYPQRLERLVVISAAHQTHPTATALRSVQRSIVELGLETGRRADALSLARALATVTYRSPREFGERFGRAPTATSRAKAAFPVERYLRHQGDKFAATWTAARFLALSLSTDLHAIDPRAIRTPTVLVAAEHDALVPRSDIAELAAGIAAPCTLIDLPTKYGHDAFLTEGAALTPILRAALRIPALTAR